KTAGSQQLTATDTVLATVTASASVTVAAAAASRLAVSAPTGTIMGTSISVTVTALDAFNNTATTYTGTVHFTSTDASAVLPANYTFVAADRGTHTFNAVLTAAGFQQLTATDTAATALTVSASVTVGAAAASRFIVSAPVASTAGGAF